MFLRMAFRNLWRHRRRSGLTILGLTLGYFLLSLAVSTTEGTYGNMIDLFTSDVTGHAQLHREGYLEKPNLNRTVNNWGEWVAKLESEPGVQGASPRVLGSALGFAGKKTTPAQVVGADPVREVKVTTLARKVKEGSLFARADEKGQILIGAGIAKSLQLKVGDELVLISQGADGSIANAAYRVRGVVGTVDSNEARRVYMTLSDAQEYFGLEESRAHEIAIRLQHFDLAKRFTANWNAKLPADSKLKFEPWQKVEDDFNQAMEADKKGNRVTFGIIVFIVSIGVLNTVLMSILERTREFGVMKALGTRPKRVMGLIMTETSLMAVLGVGIGALLSWPTSYYLSKVGIPIGTPIDISGVTYDTMLGSVQPVVFIEPLFWILGSALIVAIFPALRAARIRPIDALRSH
jgi:putative ABC transport system permease protein